MNAMESSDIIGFLFIFMFALIYRIECIVVKCNFNEYQSGCADRIGSQCDKQTHRCVCKPDFPIRLLDFCLQPKYIGEKCFASAQCKHIPNAGCYNYREEFNQNPSTFFGTLQSMWPSGLCRCKMGHTFDTNSNSCIKRMIGSWCSNLWDCRHEDKRLVNAICEHNECKCSPNHHYNQSTHDCHYRETYGNQCFSNDECIPPVLCINKTCDCSSDYHLDDEKSPKCQPNNNLNDIKSDPSLDVSKDDKTFEIFILTVIPIIIVFLTLKPCLKKLGKCKPQTDEVICGSKEISIKCSDFDKDLALGQHRFCEKLQTIEEIGEEVKVKDEKEDESEPEVEDSNEAEGQTAEKSIEKGLTKDNGVDDTTISIECSAKS